MTKLIEMPLNIALDELPLSGRNYSYSKESGELIAPLHDLIGEHDFHVQFQLLPLGNAFEIAGRVSTQMDLPCSRCGREMEYSIEENFKELLLVEEDRPRGSRTNHKVDSSDSNGPFCNYLKSAKLDVPEYIHEIIASSEPYQSYCQREDCEAEAQKKLQRQSLEEKLEEGPFSALKGLKIGTKTHKH